MDQADVFPNFFGIFFFFAMILFESIAEISGIQMFAQKSE